MKRKVFLSLLAMGLTCMVLLTLIFGWMFQSYTRRQAEEELNRALTVSGDPMILNLLGRNAQDKGEFEKAEEFLIRSTHRLPERIYPYYLLVKLYAVPEYYSREKLVRAAEKVLYSEPKVNSTAVREMRQEVRSILNERK